jgi:hypothetical protein
MKTMESYQPLRTNQAVRLRVTLLAAGVSQSAMCVSCLNKVFEVKTMKQINAQDKQNALDAHSWHDFHPHVVMTC